MMRRDLMRRLDAMDAPGRVAPRFVVEMEEGEDIPDAIARYQRQGEPMTVGGVIATPVEPASVDAWASRYAPGGA
jgi:hypothetical protein